MLTYTTLDEVVLDLGDLTHEERLYFERCYLAYRDNLAWTLFSELVTGPENPLILASGGWVTPAVADHILYQAIRDLEDRLGVRQGELAAADGDRIDRDPVGGLRTAPVA